MTREEHLTWRKRWALECLDEGDFVGAVATMSSDMRLNSPTMDLAMMYLKNGDAPAIRRWIRVAWVGAIREHHP